METRIMADNNSSNVVAIFAILIIALLAFGAYYFYMNQEGNKSTSIKVEMPSAPAVTPAPATK